MKLGEYIKEFREKMGWSQREFARRSNLSNTYVSLLEKGGINPSTGEQIQPDVNTLRSIANAMGISLHELMKTVDDCYVDLIGNIEIRPIHPDVSQMLDDAANRTLREQDQFAEIAIALEEDEKNLLSIFGSLNAEGRAYLLQQAEIAKKLYGGDN